jgi:hypothetical protein
MRSWAAAARSIAKRPEAKAAGRRLRGTEMRRKRKYHKTSKTGMIDMMNMSSTSRMLDMSRE